MWAERLAVSQLYVRKTVFDAGKLPVTTSAYGELVIDRRAAERYIAEAKLDRF